MPLAAETTGRPFCLAPDLYRTDSEQRPPAGETLTLNVAGFPCTTRSGPATNVTPCARPLAEPANVPMARVVATARGSRRFVALAVMSSGRRPAAPVPCFATDLRGCYPSNEGSARLSAARAAWWPHIPWTPGPRAVA